jgi:nanoRNase/pAp phosphatase (c-di-AMP/oligoRNAs hydrolase)
MQHSRHRLVTRADFDGLVCAALLKACDRVDEVVFVHPKDVQDGRIELGARDITAGLPYVAAVHQSFAHHAAETLRRTEHVGNQVVDPSAPSTARVIWNHHGGAAAFRSVDPSLIDAVDRASSAGHALDEVMQPTGWTLLGFVTDPRTGLGRFRRFTRSNYALMLSLTEQVRDRSAEELLALPDVAERVELYTRHSPFAVDQLLQCSSQHGNAVVVDLREQDKIWATNRFMVYALFPQCNLSIHRMWGRQGGNAVFALGRSIFERTCATDIGALCRRYGGGGVAGAGTCQIGHDLADRVYGELLATVQRDEAERRQREARR